MRMNDLVKLMFMALAIFLVGCLSEREVKNEIDEKNEENATVEEVQKENNDTVLAVDKNQEKISAENSSPKNEATEEIFKNDVQPRKISFKNSKNASFEIDEVKKCPETRKI